MRFLTIAVVTPDVTRRDTLRRWTDAELRASGAGEEQVDLFRFGVLPAAWEDVTGFFLGDTWYRIGADTPVPLIEGIVPPSG